MSEIKEPLSNLILDPRIEQLELFLSKPNIFNILRIVDAEIMHSNFLAWLFDPIGNHKLGDTFLKWFLKDIFSSQKIDWADEFIVDAIDTNKVEIVREFLGIDLVIKAENFVVIIENKVFSKEHGDQLNRYKKYDKDSLWEIDKRAFVFLTPFGDEPAKEEDAAVYINFEYSSLIGILEIILSLYGDTISLNTKQYINDYVMSVRRFILKNDKAVELAQGIYKNHREALDFIFEVKPDRLLQMMPTFENAIKECEYIPETQNKGYARFLTKKLHEVIPPTGTGWKNFEAFTFEISYWSKNLSLKCVISPGNEANRDLLLKALKNVKEARQPRGKKWLTTHSKQYKLNVQDERYDDLDELKKGIVKFLKKEEEFIKQVEEIILDVANKFES